ncbi:MAG: Uma2 family endonuclease [Chloroflexia bacterium]|nr:Uma2 family endonuclease [Chloroflexia bacterium]
MTITRTRHQFTVHDYTLMRQAGILTEDDRVELLDGEIYVMSPIGPLHVGIVNKLNRLLSLLVGTAGIVSIQNPIRLSDYSEPQPDIAILSPRDDFYTRALATPDDVLLVIEIADSSIEYDRDEKLPRYARSGICEVWIIDVHKLVIEQYTQPVQDEYTQLHKVLRGNMIKATMLPEVQLHTHDLF